jgi:hypothetical protein
MTIQEFSNYDIKNLNIIGNKTLLHGYLFTSKDLVKRAAAHPAASRRGMRGAAAG